MCNERGLIFSKSERYKLFDFQGYGNLDAPFWFLGMEDGTGGNDLVEENIKVRLRSFEAVMDLGIAHDRNHLNWPLEEQNKYPSVWMWMAKIVRALRGEDDWKNNRHAKIYIRERLGHSNGETFLTELLPLPKRSAGSWPPEYTNLYKTMKAYRADILPHRKAMLRRLIEAHSPQYLFCYGKSNYSHYKEILGLGGEEWQLLNGTKIELNTFGSTRAILSPFWGNGQISYANVALLIKHLKE